MGFPSIKQYLLILLVTAVSSTTALAAPKLRLSTTTLGPVSIAQGQNGNGVTPATPAATPGATQGVSGIVPTLQYV